MEHTYICLMPIITEMPKEKTRNNLKKYADPGIRKMCVILMALIENIKKSCLQ